MRHLSCSHTARALLVTLLMAGLGLTPLPSGYAAGPQHEEEAEKNRGAGRGRGRLDDCEHPGRGNSANHAHAAEECLPPGSSSGIARGDFNGDGAADLAIGVPGEDFDTGVVLVIYGSGGSGLTTAPLLDQTGSRPAPQQWSQDSPGMPDTGERDDLFGAALAAGDFNGDTFSDLAIAAPGELLVRSGIGVDGQVTIIFGSANGLTSTDTDVPAPQTFSVLDFDHPFRHLAADTEADIPLDRFAFGAALAWGDFDGDKVGDLAVGAPEANGVGVVGVLFGVSGVGLSSQRNEVYTEGSGFPGGGRQFNDRFGEVLAGGDFNGDAITDLAIGIPFREVPGTEVQDGVPVQNAGVVLIVFGSLDTSQGPIETRVVDETTLFALSAGRPTPTTGGLSQTGALFGRALAAGDFDGNGLDDLAMAAPFKATGGARQAGGVWVLAGPLDPALSDIQFWSQSRVFPNSQQIDEIDQGGSPNEPEDRFGTALAAGDFNADSRDDLAIGVPFEDLRIQTGAATFDLIVDAGAVNVLYGSPVGLSIEQRKPQFWTQRFINGEDTAESGDRFGARLTAWNFGRNEILGLGNVIRTADLAIGATRENVGGIVDAGAVNVIYGLRSANGLRVTQNPPFSSQFWTQDTPGIPGTAERDDHFGDAVY